jgi:hypothetical protein
MIKQILHVAIEYSQFFALEKNYSIKAAVQYLYIILRCSNNI